MAPPRPPGLKHLASELGLSITTVSRALAGYSDVSAETRARVVTVARANEYVPNRAGRMLVSGRSDFIGMLLPVRGDEIIDSYLSEFLVGLTTGLSRRGRDLFLAAVAPGEDDLTVLRHMVDSQRADGIVLYRTFCDDPRARFLADRRVPFTSHGRTLTLDASYAWVDTDGEGAFALAARQLIDLGHTEFAFFGPTQPYAYAYFRQRGLETTLRDCGLRLCPDRIVTAPAGDTPGDCRGRRSAARSLTASDGRVRSQGQIRPCRSRGGQAAWHRGARPVLGDRLRRPAGRRLCKPAALDLRAADDGGRRDPRRPDRRSPGARAAGGRAAPHRTAVHSASQPRPGATSPKRKIIPALNRKPKKGGRR